MKFVIVLINLLNLSLAFYMVLTFQQRPS